MAQNWSQWAHDVSHCRITGVNFCFSRKPCGTKPAANRSESSLDESNNSNLVSNFKDVILVFHIHPP